MVKVAGLDLVERDNYGFEENHVLFPQRNRETADNTREDVQKLGCAVKFIIFMD